MREGGRERLGSEPPRACLHEPEDHPRQAEEACGLEGQIGDRAIRAFPLVAEENDEGEGPAGREVAGLEKEEQHGVRGAWLEHCRIPREKSLMLREGARKDEVQIGDWLR